MEEQHKFSRQLLDSTEAERKRIASELHDGLGQELLVIKNRALLALEDIKSKKKVKEHLDEISETASQAIQEIREISYNLRPYQIDRLGLSKAIESIVKRAVQTTEIDIISHIDPIDNLMPKGMEIRLYRIIQECVNNIIKHAKASIAKVSIKRLQDYLNIEIDDNGVGFDASAEKMKDMQGFGLRGITERVHLLKGNIKIISFPGNGTKILINIKLDERTT